jgi:hypothetical protein
VRHFFILEETFMRNSSKEILSISLLSVFSTLLNSQVYANEEKKENEEATPNQTEIIENQTTESLDKPYYAVIGEGKTLPERVFRLKAPLKFSWGNKSFDSKGNKVDNGLSISAGVLGIKLEYGITNDLSLQVGAPVVLQNRFGLNGEKFLNSEKGSAQVKKFLSGVAAKMQALGVCKSTETCNSLIQNNYVLPVRNVVLPTGEVLTVQNGVPVKTIAESLVANAIKPANGKAGFGDMEVGLLYSLINERGPISGQPIYVSTGLGMRIPTGQFEKVPAGQRVTGRGTLDLGFRLNLDYNPFPGVYFLAENLSETMLASGKKRRSSLISSTELNTADPTNATLRAAGADGVSNSQKFERKGIRNLGFVRASWGLGNLSQDLKWAGLYTQFKYDFDGEERLDGLAQGEKRRLFSWQTAFIFDGLAYKIPAQLEFEYDTPVAGKNVSVATQGLTTTFKTYYRF